MRSNVGSWVCVGGRHYWYPILIPPTLPVLSLHVLAASCMSIHGSAWGCLWLLGPCMGRCNIHGSWHPESSRQLGYLRLESQYPSFHPVDGPTLRCFHSIPRDPSKGELWLPVVVLCWLTGPLLASFISPLPYCASWDHLTSCTWTLVSECALREPKPKTCFSVSGKLTAFVFWAGWVGWGGSEEVSTFQRSSPPNTKTLGVQRDWHSGLPGPPPLCWRGPGNKTTPRGKGQKVIISILFTPFQGLLSPLPLVAPEHTGPTLEDPGSGCHLQVFA